MDKKVTRENISNRYEKPLKRSPRGDRNRSPIHPILCSNIASMIITQLIPIPAWETQTLAEIDLGIERDEHLCIQVASVKLERGIHLLVHFINKCSHQIIWTHLKSTLERKKLSENSKNETRNDKKSIKTVRIDNHHPIHLVLNIIADSMISITLIPMGA